MDCSPLGSSVHGIFQARILEWVAISFSGESSRPRDQTLVSCIAGRFFTNWATREAPHKLLLLSKWQQQSTNPDVGHRFKCKASYDCPGQMTMNLALVPSLFSLFSFSPLFGLNDFFKWFYFSSFIDLWTITLCSVILVIALIHIYKIYSSDILHHIYCKTYNSVLLFLLFQPLCYYCHVFYFLYILYTIIHCYCFEQLIFF